MLKKLVILKQQRLTRKLLGVGASAGMGGGGEGAQSWGPGRRLKISGTDRRRGGRSGRTREEGREDQGGQGRRGGKIGEDKGGGGGGVELTSRMC